MRGSLSRARLLTAAFAAVVVAAAGASSALATSNTGIANGVSVTASLSPDSVKKGDTVSQQVTVKNVSEATENLAVRIVGPLQTSIPTAFSVTLKAGAQLSRAVSFPAALLKPGTSSLFVAAVNRATNQGAQASASVTRLP